MTKFELKYPIDNLEFEHQYLHKGCINIAGVDEVGRGPLAGNVVCAAVIMPLDDIIPMVTDSKMLSEKKRNLCYDIIMERAIAVSIEESPPSVIDEINILEATKLTMKAAVNGLSVIPDVVLVDALKLDINMEQVAIIKGDLRSYTIACASIVAKVYRDRQITEQSRDYPEYGWAKNKGYGSAAHIAAIREHGATPLHRRSFIKNFLEVQDE